jgi:hypothetical protein
MVGRVFWGAEGCNAGSMFSGKTIYWEGDRPEALLTVRSNTTLCFGSFSDCKAANR